MKKSETTRGLPHPKTDGPLSKMNKGFVYILFSLKDQRTYVGSTEDLQRRIKEHNGGQVKSTKHRRPLILLYSEERKSLQEARKKELWWKNGAGRERMKDLFNNTNSFKPPN